MERFKGKVCVVTASTAGIGFAIAQRMAQEGGRVVISSRGQKNVDAAVEQLTSKGLDACGVSCHVAKERKKLLDYVNDRFGKIDVLVSNAAVSPHFGSTIETTEEAYDKLWDINVKSTFFLIKDAMPLLEKSSSPSILIVSSFAGFNPSPLIGIYSVTKTALLGLTKVLASELGPKIRVNGLAPGVIKTSFSKPIWDSATNNPLERIGLPEECASAAAYLCSSEASYITGENLVVSGGIHSRI